MNITERGWYQLRNGQYVEVIHVNKYGSLTVALHDHETGLYAYFSDGLRGVQGVTDPQYDIVTKLKRKPSKRKLDKQRKATMNFMRMV